MSFEIFFSSYIECALWSSTDNADDSGGEPLDANYGEDDIAPEALKALRDEARDFYDANVATWDAIEYDDSQAGHDFWLTRNGHGAGFWDRGIGEVGEVLTKASKVYGSCDIYVGDDGKLYT